MGRSRAQLSRTGYREFLSEESGVGFFPEGRRRRGSGHGRRHDGLRLSTTEAILEAVS
jgi:1-acyl-sn-glycerol-3-phosphate acyltransferase